MHQVQRRAGARGQVDGVAGAVGPSVRVDVGGCSRVSGDGERGDELLVAGGRRVGEAEPDRGRPLFQTFAEERHDLRDLLRRGWIVLGDAGGQELARVAQHPHAHRDVADAGAVVHRLPAPALGVEGRDVSGLPTSSSSPVVTPSWAMKR